MCQANRPCRPATARRARFGDPQIGRSRQVLQRLQDAAQLRPIRRSYHGQLRLGARQSKVFQGVVRRPRVAVGVAAANPEHPDRQPMQHRTVAELLVAPHRAESGDRVDVRDIADLGQAGRDAQHVLFGHSDIDEPLGVRSGERLDDAPAEVGRQEHDPIVPLRQFDEHLDQCRSHPAASISAIAVA